MARGVCPECGGASCALQPVCPGEPPVSPPVYGTMCRTCPPDPGNCDGGCDLPPFMD